MILGYQLKTHPTVSPQKILGTVYRGRTNFRRQMRGLQKGKSHSDNIPTHPNRSRTYRFCAEELPPPTFGCHGS